MIYVLNALNPELCSLEGIDEVDDVKRAEIAISNARAMGCGEVIGPRDIIAGNPKVTLLFLAEIFNTKHGLEDLSNEEYVKATAYMFEYYCLAGKKKPSGTSLSRVKL